VLCDDEMKYSGNGRVISCQMSLCWSAKAELSGDRRKRVKVSRVMTDITSLPGSPSEVSGLGD